jgi:hypothetical protein
MTREALWTFETARFLVEFTAEPEDMDPADSFQFDDDIAFARQDEPAHWFRAKVAVYLKGESSWQDLEIGTDYLSACSYNSSEEFVTGHRDPDASHRNCSLYPGRIVCHYFPSMVREAIADARRNLANLPQLRNV